MVKSRKRKDWKPSDGVDRRLTKLVHIQCAFWNDVGMMWVKKKKERKKKGDRGKHADVSRSCPLGGSRHLLVLIGDRFLWMFENKQANAEKTNIGCLTQ